MGQEGYPQFDEVSLANNLESWLKRGGVNAPMFGIKLSPRGANYLDRQGTVVYMRCQHVEQLFWFEEQEETLHSPRNKEYLFLVHNIGVGAESIHDFEEAVERKRNKLRERGRFERIYGSPDFSFGEYGFRGDIWQGVTIMTPVLYFPLRESHYVSDEIFLFGDEGIAKPARGVINKILKTKGTI